VYVLCRTSNQGAADFQSLVLESNRQLFLEVARKIDQWYVPGAGLVMGATALEELEGAMWTYYDSAKPVPFLVPGVGSQGASAAATAKALRDVWSAIFPIHRINSSSGIAYAFKREGTEDYVGSALREIAKMNAQIGKV
jgi:orotidine-5'-phosphate decarboxylase